MCAIYISLKTHCLNTFNSIQDFTISLNFMHALVICDNFHLRALSLDASMMSFTLCEHYIILDPLLVPCVLKGSLERETALSCVEGLDLVIW